MSQRGPPPRRITAIVLGHVDYKDADRVVHLITAEDGRISVMARGARRRKNPYGQALDMGNRVQIELRPGRGDLGNLASAKLEHGHGHLRENLTHIALAAYFCEITSALARTGQAEPRLFGLLDVALLVLDASTETVGSAVRAGMEAKALTFAGLTPQLERCPLCSEPLDGELVFSAQAGGAIHQHCGGGMRVSGELVRALERARRTPLAELVDEELPDGPRWLLYELLRWHVGRPLRSQSVLVSLS